MADIGKMWDKIEQAIQSRFECEILNGDLWQCAVLIRAAELANERQPKELANSLTEIEPAMVFETDDDFVSKLG